MAILDADKEGFLRSETSLIQTAGRAARHLNGEVILYADVKTQSIQRFLAVCEYRRKKQLDYNAAHGITPRSVSRAIEESLSLEGASRHEAEAVLQETAGNLDLTQSIAEIEEEMLAAANNLEFEKAAVLRDQVRELKRLLSGAAQSPAPERSPSARSRGAVNYRKGKRRA